MNQQLQFRIEVCVYILYVPCHGIENRVEAREMKYMSVFYIIMLLKQ